MSVDDAKAPKAKLFDPPVSAIKARQMGELFRGENRTSITCPAGSFWSGLSGMWRPDSRDFPLRNSGTCWTLWPEANPTSYP
jgi:hypothetical protein